MAGRPVVLDLETTGLDPRTDTIISGQLCVAGSRAAIYFDGDICDQLATLTVPLILHNFKFDFAFLLLSPGGPALDLRRPAMHGPSWLRDTMLLHHLLDENAAHDLDSIVKERWGDAYKEIFWSKYKSFVDAPLDARMEYSLKDVIFTGLLYEQLCLDLGVQQVPESLVGHVHSLALALYDTEVRGVRVDLDYLVCVGQELKERIDSATLRMRALVPNELAIVEDELWLERIEKAQGKVKTEKGKANTVKRIKREPLNWDSGPQLQKLIYGELGLPVQTKWDKKNKVRKPTLCDEAMEELADLHPLVAELRAHRGDQKVYGSFIEGTLERQQGGRIYPTLNVNGTDTGRLSHSNPNLAQLPASGGIRGIYCADEGHLLISADFGMIEVVVAAHYSKDPALLKIIYEGASKHDITAEALGVPRSVAKTLNFAIGYGATEFKVKQILGCSVQEAKGVLRRYWEAYAGEKKVIDECQKRVDAGLPIIGLYGRRRRFPHVFESDSAKAKIYRQAYNALIQGSAADITHQAYYTTANYLERAGIGRTLFQVHDQIVAEAKEERAEEALAQLVCIMQDTGKERLSVPLLADPQGPMKNWQD